MSSAEIQARPRCVHQHPATGYPRRAPEHCAKAAPSSVQPHTPPASGGLPHSPQGGNGHELKHMKWPKHQEHLFMVTEHWHRLHGEVLGSPSQEMFKSIWTQSWATHCRWPCLSRGIGPGPQPQSSLSYPVIHDGVITRSGHRVNQ